MLHFNLLLLFFLFQLHNIEIIIFTMRYIFFSIFCVVVVWQVLVGFQFFVVVRFSFPVTLCVIAKFFFSYNVSLAKFVIFPLQCASCEAYTSCALCLTLCSSVETVHLTLLANISKINTFYLALVEFVVDFPRRSLNFNCTLHTCTCMSSCVELERCTVSFCINTSQERGQTESVSAF